MTEAPPAHRAYRVLRGPFGGLTSSWIRGQLSLVRTGMSAFGSFTLVTLAKHDSGWSNVMMAPSALVNSELGNSDSRAAAARVRPPIRPRSPGRILFTAVAAGGLTAALALIAAVRVLSWLDISAGRGWTVAVAVWTVVWACVGTWTGQPLFIRLTARSHRR